MTNDNYRSPKPSLCNCEEEYHEPNCLFYDPYRDDPVLRAELAEEYATDSDTDLVFDPYYGCYVPRDLDALLDTEHENRAGLPATEQWLTATAAFSTCRHYMDAFTLPTGTALYLSGWSHTPVNRPDEMYPDVGVYLAEQWFPADNFAYHVSWQDFGLPTIPDWHVTRHARATIAHAEQGDVVEVGCLGAHGRTGSFLAILVMLDDPSYSGKRAIKYVRDNHCHSAVETKEQERYVSRISGALKRGEL